MGDVSDKFEWFSVDEDPLPTKFKQPVPYATPTFTIGGDVNTGGGNKGVSGGAMKSMGRNLARAKNQGGK
jgi:hypothetical protein